MSAALAKTLTLAYMMYKELADKKLKPFYGNVTCKNVIYCILFVFIKLTDSKILQPSIKTVSQVAMWARKAV